MSISAAKIDLAVSTYQSGTMTGSNIQTCDQQMTARARPDVQSACYSPVAVRCLEENTLFGYVHGALDAAGGDAVRAHAASCDACRMLIAAAARATPTEPALAAGAITEWSWPAIEPQVNGRTIAGKYTLTRVLGAGGMGVVYEAVNTWTGRRVAIKELHSSYSSDPHAVLRFKLEAKAASRIAHPNVVEILDMGQDPTTGSLFMVQELLTGSTLRQRIAERGTLTIDEIIRVMAPALSALVAAHDAGVIHRDLKPDNIFLASDGVGGEVTKLIDFGLSKQLHRELALDVTGEGRQLGTPFYMSPEQLRAEADLDERTDVWAMGVVMFEMLAGIRPFVGPSYNELVVQILTSPVPQLAELVPALPTPIAALVANALERDRTHRMRSRELRDAFEELALRPEMLAAPQGNPYRGLLPFESTHRGVFFGRSSDVSAVLDRLRTQSFVLVAGDSGVGKSSLVRAGILPALAASMTRNDVTVDSSGCAAAESPADRIAITTPGPQPVRALAQAFAPILDEDVDSLAEQLADDASAVGERLQRRMAGIDVVEQLNSSLPRPRFILCFDQFEELLTLADGGEAAFAALALASLLDAAPGLRLIATVRSDFLARLAALPGLGDAITGALYLCKPLSQHSIREVVVGPARLTGLRFESPGVVDELVASVGSSASELPLLQFALAQLWESRDVQRNMICSASLQAIGGVTGALAVHADRVLALIPPRHAALARQVLTHLVTEDGTRARKTARELSPDSGESLEAVQIVLETLVQGRLLCVEDGGGEPSYQIAHDVLVEGWGTLRGWRGRDIERWEARERLQRAAAEWERLGRPTSALWNRAQLAEVADITTAALEQRAFSLGAVFLGASRRAVRRRRIARYIAAVGIPTLVVAGFVSAQLVAHRRTARVVAEHVRAADAALATAATAEKEIDQLRTTAFAAFDRQQRETAETAWAKALERQNALDATYRLASQRLEAALALDGGDRMVRRRFAALLLDRAQLAERSFKPLERDELAQRMAAYDDNGVQQARWNAAAGLSIATTPTRATVSAQQVVPGSMSAPIGLGATPVSEHSLRPGSYIIRIEAPGRTTVRAPILLARGEHAALNIPIPLKIPDGYAYVPPGRFLYGSSDSEDIRRTLLNAQPLHAVSTPGYLIARHEVTFGDWIEFLRTLPVTERATRLPRATASVSTGAGAYLELAESAPNQFRLTLQPSSHRYVATTDEFIEYRSRSHSSQQHWLRMPVSGITWDDVTAYARWLDQTGALPGARPCDEHEWERSARGADARLFPASDELKVDDANVAETYGRRPDAFGPDEGGAHPHSDSPFGVSDLAGNVWEWVTSVSGDEQTAIRGGAWYYNQVAARSNNREPAEPTLRSITVGLRICTSIVASELN